MGLYYSASEDIYWLDGSFIQTSTINDGNKISYAGNHSAIINSGTNCRSKWGLWPLVDHPIGYGPLQYNMSQRTYYTTLSMGGPTILCNSSNVNYSTPAYVNCTYNWTYDTNRFDYISGQGTNNFQIAPKNPLVSGQAWVKLTLTINSPINKTREITKNVWVGPYSSTNYPITGPSSAPCRQYVYYSIPSLENVFSINWVWPSGWTYVSGQGTRYLALQTGTTGSGGIVGVQVVNTCGSPGSYATMYTSVFGTCGYSLSVSPNPATGEATIELVGNSKETLAVGTEWDLEVYDSMQGMKEKKTNIKTTQTKINTFGWKDGVYIVRAKIGDEVISEKLVVKH